MKAGYLGAASVEKIDDKMFICVNNTIYNTMTQIIMYSQENKERSVYILCTGFLSLNLLIWKQSFAILFI